MSLGGTTMSVQKRTRSGQTRWVARYYGSDGRERSKTFDTQKAAKAWVAERHRELRRGEWIDPRNQEATAGELWPQWQDAARTDGTRRARELVGRNLGRLEHTTIGAIRPADVRAWKRHLEAGRPWKPGCTGLADNTVAAWTGQLAGFFNWLVAEELLLRSPAAGIGKKTSRSQAVHAVTRAELVTTADIWRFVDAARAGVPTGRGWVAADPTLARMIVVGAATGLRAGEIAGLRIRSVDFLRREATIVEQSKSGTSTYTWAPLKTPAARRVLPLPDHALDALAEELRYNPCADRSMPVFRTVHGRLDVDEQVTWHSLRHFYASALIHAGASVKTVQERLGHESAETTLQVYAHLWPGEDERTRAAVDGALVRDQYGTGGEQGDSDDESAPAAGQATGAEAIAEAVGAEAT